MACSKHVFPNPDCFNCRGDQNSIRRQERQRQQDKVSKRRHEENVAQRERHHNERMGEAASNYGPGPELSPRGCLAILIVPLVVLFIVVALISKWTGFSWTGGDSYLEKAAPTYAQWHDVDGKAAKLIRDGDCSALESYLQELEGDWWDYEGFDRGEELDSPAVLEEAEGTRFDAEDGHEFLYGCSGEFETVSTSSQVPDDEVVKGYWAAYLYADGRVAVETGATKGSFFGLF